MSNLALAFAAGLMNQDRKAAHLADYQRGLNLAADDAPVAPLPPDAMPVTTPDAYAKFPVGSAVRDILSGIDGVVAAPPEGEFGDVVFITGNEDGKTYAVRFDQVKSIDSAPSMGAPMPTEVVAPPMPVEEPGGMAPGEPAIAPASLKATSDKYREHLKAKSALVKAAAAIGDQTLVVAANDDRKLTFKHLKAHLTAMSEPKAKDAVAFIGYVPKNFDSIWAALVRDGVKVVAENAVFHVEQMVAKGMTADEIKFTVCSANGGVLGKLIASMPPTAKPTEPAPAGMTYVWDSKLGEWTTVSASLKPQAEGDSSQGQPIKVPSYDPKSPASGAPAYPVEKNKDEGTTKTGKDSAGAVVKVSTSDPKSPASGAPAYPVLDPDKAGGMKAGAGAPSLDGQIASLEDEKKAHPERSEALSAEIKKLQDMKSNSVHAVENSSAGKPINVKTFDEQSKASGAPKYPTAGPSKTGGDAPRDQTVDTLGLPIEVKTFDNQAPASGAPNYPVLDPSQAGGQATPGTPAVSAPAPLIPSPAAPAPSLEAPKPEVTPNATAPKPEPPKPEPAPSATSEAPPVKDVNAPPAPPKEEPKEPKEPKAEEKPKAEDKSKEPKSEPKSDEEPKAEEKKDDKKDDKAEPKKDEKKDDKAEAKK